jgi:hypothetical protein
VHPPAPTGLMSLQCCRTTDAGLAHLVRGCRQLQELSLSGCGLITDAGAAQLAQLASLQVLDLSGACGVGPAGMTALKQLPLLRRLVVDAAGWQTEAAAPAGGAAGGADAAADGAAGGSVAPGGAAAASVV